MSVQKKKTDQQSRAFWSFARDVSKEVEAWPTWKRQALVSFSGNVSPTTSERGQRAAPTSARHTSTSRDTKTGRCTSMKGSERPKSTTMIKNTKNKQGDAL